MQYHSRFVRRRRALASLLCVTVASMGCVGGDAPPAPHAGVYDHEDTLRVAFKGFEVNAAGGNLFVERRDFSIDTWLGTIALSHTYNSATEQWRWSHEPTLVGNSFSDASGAEFSLEGLEPEDRIPGSPWRFVDARTLRTSGGLVHRFDASGMLETMHWQHAEYPQLRFSAGAIEQCSDAATCVGVFTLTRDPAGRIVAIDDRAGRHAEYVWNEQGMLEHSLDAFSYEEALPGTVYEYGGLFRGRIRALVHPDGERFEFDYELMGGRVVEVREPAAPTSATPTVAFHYERDPVAASNSTRVTNALGAPCTFVFDDLGRAESMTNAVGELRQWGWNGLRKSYEIGPGGDTTSWTYGADWESESTALGNLVTRWFAPGALNREDPFAPAVALESDSIGVIEEREFDASGRMVALRDGSGTEWSWTYHPDGSVASTTAPDEGTLLYSQYGEHGHAESIEHENPELNDPFWSQPPEYDAVGNLVRGSQVEGLYDPGRPGIVERHFDARRRISRLDLAGQEATPLYGGNSTLLSYSSGSIDLERRHDGQLQNVWRPYGADSEFEYDEAGRLLRRRDRVDGQWVDAVVIAYDAVGNVLQLDHANGVSDRTDYDSQNRPVLRRLLRDGALEQSLALVWQNGRVVSRSDSEFGAAETTVWDAAGNPIWVHYPAGETLEHQYDLRGRETLRRYWMPNGSGGALVLRELSWSWDAAGHPLEFWDGVQLVQSKIWTDGEVEQVESANGLVRTFTRDELGRIDSIETRDAAEALLESTAINRTNCVWTTITCMSATTNIDSNGFVQSAEGYRIDSHHFESLVPESAAGARVLRWEEASGSTPLFYHYDLLGNLSGIGFDFPSVLGTGVAAVGWNAEHNRMQSLPDHRIEWDAQLGQLVPAGAHGYAYDDAGFVTQRDGTAIEWTSEGRIAAIGSDTFRWAIGGRPIERSLGGVTTRYLFDGSVLADAAGTPTAIRVGPEIEIDLAAGTHRYRHLDFRDNPSFTTDESGEVVAQYSYEPTGMARDHRNPGSGEVPLGALAFGQGDHLGDGLMLLGDRVLDVAAGRFLSPDPLWHLQSQYAYAQGNPLWFRDFDGRLTFPNPGERIPAGLISDAIETVGEAAVVAGQATNNGKLVAVGSVLIAVAHILRLHGLEVHSDGPLAIRRRFGQVEGCRPRATLAGEPGC